MAISYADAKQRLAQHGQSHVLAFWETLGEAQRGALLRQVETLDFESLACMRTALTRQAGDESGAFEPSEVVCAAGATRVQARAAGEDALRRGRVGVILVAGGQGTRLGFDGPKGVFPLAPLSGATLFEIHARKLLALERALSTRVPFYLMTSDANNAPTCAFFEQNRYFGLAPERVRFFTQGMWPALWPDGRLVLDRPEHLFMGPDGHGGVLAALRSHGMLEDMQARGVDTLFYFQVDNPLVDIADPVFVGLHCMRQMQMSVKVCAKRDPQEGLGVVVTRNGRNAVVEYTELTEAQKRAVLPNGELKYKFGSVAIHLFSLEFLKQESGARLPLHIAHKKVPYCDSRGTTVQPDKPNAYKFERFIFDALPHAERSLNLEFAREDEFSPVKNASGADSPETARRDMTRKFARWLQACDVAVPLTAEGDPACRLEIDPCYARDSEGLRRRLPRGFRVTGDTLLRQDD